jgi:hypothetical protein
MAFESVGIVSTRNGSTAVTGFRQDLLAGETVGLALSSTIGVTSVLWELLGRPEFSAAGGVGPEPVVLATAPTSSFVVDADAGAVHKDGTYLVRATINPGSPGQVRKTCAVARVSGLTIAGPSGALALRKPGGFEALEDTSNANCRQGYATPENRWHELLRSIAVGGGIIETLAGAYAVGAGAVDQTLLLNNANGGGIVIDGSGGGFTGTSPLRINTAAAGPFVVDRATGNVGIGIAAPLEELHIKSASPGLRLERTGGAAISLENITDVLNLINRTGPVTIATFPGTGGMRTDFGVGIGAAAPTAAAWAMGAGSAVAVSAASTGRFRYNEVAQQFEVSQNGGAYAPIGAGAVSLLEADGATTGAVPLNTLAFPATGTVVARLKARRDFVFLDRTSTATVDNFQYFAALGGVGRWVRMLIVDPFWSTQATFFVDPANVSTTANDDNTGVDGTHQLRSLSEYHLRLWGAQLPADQTITIAADLNANDTVQGFFNIIKNGLTFGGYPHYVGVQNVLFSGTLTSVVNQNGATSQSMTVTCAGLSGTWSNSGTAGATLVERTIRRTSDGSTARVVQDLGSKTAILSVPITVANLPITWSNGDAFTVYSVPSLGAQVATHAATTEFHDLRVTAGRWFCQYGQLFQYNCEGDVIIDGDFGFSANGLSGLISGASYLVSRGTGSITGGYHRLIAAGGQIRINTTTTVKALQVEGESVITAINGGSQGTADIEFNQTGTQGNLAIAINFLGISGGRIINSGYTYGSIGSANTLVNFQGRGQRMDVAHVPTVTGGAGASQITTTQGATATTNVSVLATRMWDDLAGNSVVGPAGTTVNDNRGQTMLNLGSAAGVGTSAVNWNDVLGAVGGAPLSFAQGSIPFAGVSGVLTQDNANLFWDNTNKRLGIGTATPSTVLDIVNNVVGVNSQLRVINTSTSTSPTAAQLGTSNGTHATRLGTMGLNSTAFIAATPNLTAGMTFLLAVSSTGMYIGSPNTISFQTGSTQAERLKILTTGEVQLSSLATGGMVKAAAGGQLGLGVAGTDFLAPPGGGLTAGSVLFGGAGGSVAQDNANFFWDDVNNRLGIGTTTPIYPMEVDIGAAVAGPTGYRAATVSTATDARVQYWATNSSRGLTVGVTGQSFTPIVALPNMGASMPYVTTSGALGATLYIGSDSVITLQTGATQAERLRIASTGEVTISNLGGTGGFVQADTAGKLSIATLSGPPAPVVTITAGAGLTGGGTTASNMSIDVAATDGSIAVAANSIGVGVLQNDGQHGSLGGGADHAVATTAFAGFMSGADKTILNNARFIVQATTNAPASAFSLGALASGVLQHVVTGIVSAPTSLAVVGGQVPFGQASGSGLLDQDQNFFWDNTNKRLALGTQIPSCVLTIDHSGTNDANTLVVINSNAGAAANASVAVSNLTAAGALLMNGTGHSGGGTTPNIGHNVLALSTSIPGPTPTLYLGSHGIITLQTGATQAERLKIDVSGNVSISNLAASGVVQAALTTGQLSVTTLVPGQIPFGAAAGGGLAQDVNFFWDATNHRLGVGTNTPGSVLDVRRNAAGLTTVSLTNNSGAAGTTSAVYGAANGTTTADFGVTGTAFTGFGGLPNLLADTAFLTGGNDLYIGTSRDITFQTGATQAEAMRVLSTGEVAIPNKLIGGTTAAHQLILQGTTHATLHGNITCLDPLGVGRNPGIIGGAPMFAVAGNVSVNSSVSAGLDWAVFNTSTITITGSTNITTAGGFNWFTVQPPIYDTSVIIGAGGSTPAAATLCISGVPSIKVGATGSFAGAVGAVGLWVQGPAQVDGNLRMSTGSIVVNAGDIVTNGTLAGNDIQTITGRSAGSFFVGTAPVWAISASVDVGPSNPKIGFFNATPVVRPTVTGPRSTGTALQNLLSLLGTVVGGLGLIQDSSTP